MKHISFLLCLLSLSLNLVAFCKGDDVQFVYSGFVGTNLTLDGNATVTPDGLLVLTSSKTNLKGHAFYPTPLRFRKSSNGTVQSFSVTFVFAIVSDYGFSAHGMAFLVAPNKNFSTALPAGYLGFLNTQNNGNLSNHIFAVELDTVQNTDFQDINDNHVGIDINDLHSVRSHYTGFYDDKNGIFKNLSLVSRKVMQVWVDYDGEATQINVTLAPIEMAKPVRPLVSAAYDLSTVLTEQAYVGFSSATGGINSRHYVLGWSFGMNNSAPAIDITKLPKLPRVGPKASSRILEIILPLATATFILTVGTVVTLLVWRHRRYAELREDWEAEFGPHRFSYKDLFYATDGFKDKHLLGVGGFGKVYKGVLQTSKLEIAVKRVSHESRQGMKEFIAEVVSLGHLRHRNLVQLFGYCRRKGEFFLVYEYMPNDSLDKYLYGEKKPILDWPQRFLIIKGVASSLLYLHEEWEKIVIHRDIKTNNVLLDNEMNGCLGDFGLARLYDHDTDPQTTHVVGTMGYLAPELVRTGKASPLTDVFAFGAFLLEVTCGQRPVNNNVQHSQQTLVDWVLEHLHKGSLTKTVDPRLQDHYNVDEACLVLKIGLLCSHVYTDTRPSMKQIIQYLNGDIPLPELTSTNISFSMLTPTQNEGFDSYIMSYPSSVSSVGIISPTTLIEDYGDGV